MHDRSTPALISNSSLVELFFLEVCPSHLTEFSQAAAAAHDQFTGLQGYDGMRIVWLNNLRALILIGWNTRASFDMHLPHMLHGKHIKQVLQYAKVISHEPALVNSWDVADTPQGGSPEKSGVH